MFDKTVYIIGILAAGWSGYYLLYRALNKKSTLWGSARLVYGIIGVFEVYHAVIYTLVICGVLATHQYGMYLRPFVSIYLMAPALVAIIHRRGGRL